MTATLPRIDPRTLSEIISPSLVVFRDRVVANIESMIRLAGSADRLRPHCKTHKMPAVVRLLLEHGITRHKAATIAEAEMLADSGAPDVLLAYNPVGPNMRRVIALIRRFPECRFSVTADHELPMRQMSRLAVEAGVTIDVMIDLNVGMGRTGVEPESARALELAKLATASPGIRLAGLHIYDGHVREPDPELRLATVQANWKRVAEYRRRLSEAGITVDRLVCGGTPTFPTYCRIFEAGMELSPGTSVLFDTGYGDTFPDLPFVPAAALVTRVISCPAPDCLTLDLGTKAVASDPPKGHRVVFPDLPDAVQIAHNEEHLVLQTPQAAKFQPGDALLAIPVHVCPTSALYDSALVIVDGEVAETWEVTGRHRVITV